MLGSKFLVFHPISIKFGVLIEHHLNTEPVKFGVNRFETLTRVSDLKLNFFYGTPINIGRILIRFSG